MLEILFLRRSLQQLCLVDSVPSGRRLPVAWLHFPLSSWELLDFIPGIHMLEEKSTAVVNECSCVLIDSKPLSVSLIHYARLASNTANMANEQGGSEKCSFSLSPLWQWRPLGQVADGGSCHRGKTDSQLLQPSGGAQNEDLHIIVRAVNMLKLAPDC